MNFNIILVILLLIINGGRTSQTLLITLIIKIELKLSLIFFANHRKRCHYCLIHIIMSVYTINWSKLKIAMLLGTIELRKLGVLIIVLVNILVNTFSHSLYLIWVFHVFKGVSSLKLIKFNKFINVSAFKLVAR